MVMMAKQVQPATPALLQAQTICNLNSTACQERAGAAELRLGGQHKTQGMGLLFPVQEAVAGAELSSGVSLVHSRHDWLGCQGAPTPESKENHTAVLLLFPATTTCWGSPTTCVRYCHCPYLFPFAD